MEDNEEKEEENANIYHKEYREELLDGDEIDDNESGFMNGYEGAYDEDSDKEDEEVV